MAPRIVRLATTLSLLAGLVACATAPDRQAAVTNGTIATTGTMAAIVLSPSYSLTELPSKAEPGDAPDPSVLQAQPGERKIPASLGGETPREFQRGQASWYGPGFHGRRTASGERFNMNEFTAAHRTLPFGTLVRVHSLVNGHDVDVRITDRGPYSSNRIIDISRAAADELGMLGLGFKEVVLLVPESSPGMAFATVSSAPPRRRARRPAATPRTRPP